jgi:hypothetical protein
MKDVECSVSSPIIKEKGDESHGYYKEQLWNLGF